MKVAVAMDSFKGSMTSMEAGLAVAEGIHRVDTTVEVKVFPLADGGEGTVNALVSGLGGEIINVTVTGPLGMPVVCEYGILKDTHTAVIEMSGAAGLTLVPKEKRNPLETTTFGVGEVIKDAIRKRCRRFIIGIGGSATNDGGVGMLQAFGYKFLDCKGEEIPLGAKGLQNLYEIVDEDVLPELSECEFLVACDVTNPLIGENGCSQIFGPQKGATPAMIENMDRWLCKYAELSKEKVPKADACLEGTGAAGGLGFAFQTFLNAVLEPGVQIVMREIQLEQSLLHTDLVITGEGKLDRQTIMGKAPIGIAKLAKKYGKTVIAFSGAAEEDAYLCNSHGIDAFFPILQNAMTQEQAMNCAVARRNLIATAEQVYRLWKIKN